MLEHLAARGAGSPLHVHRHEDEWFYVVDGELTFWVGGQVIEASAGAGSKGCCAPSASRRAQVCAEYGIDVLGPPGIPT